MTYYTTTVALAMGDVVCLDTANPGRVTLATTANLLLARAALGVSKTAAAALGVVEILDSGTVPNSITTPDLPAVADFALVKVVGNRCARVTAWAQNDYMIGVAAPSGVLTIQVHNEVKTTESRLFNVRDFGAKADGTDDLASFNAAIAAMGPPAQQDGPGNTLVIPPGTYTISGDLHVTRHLTLQGAHRQQTVLQFAAGKGIIVDYNALVTGSTGPDGGGGSETSIRDLRVECTALSLGNWAAANAYSLNSLVRAPGEFRWHYGCVVAGTSGATSPNRPHSRFIPGSALGHKAWTAGAARSLGDPIYVSLHPKVWFECTTAGTSGTSPTWSPTIGSTTTDGTAVWTCRAIQKTWTANTAYSIGQLVMRSVLANAVLFECTAISGTGTSAGSEPAWNETLGATTIDNPGANQITWTARALWPTTPDSTAPWKAQWPYLLGQLVASSSGLSASPPVYFRCTTVGTSGSSAPTWNTTAGATTADGTAVWTAIAGASSPPAFTDIWVKDNSVLWACKVAAGIWLRSKAHLRDLWVGRATSAAIHVQAEVSGIPPTNANDWTLERSYLFGSGVGLAVIASDTNVGHVSACVFGSNKGWGVWDQSFMGCVFVACEANGNGGPYNADRSGARSLFLGCYFESGQRAANLSAAGSLWMGGITAGNPAFNIDSYGVISAGTRFVDGVFSPQVRAENVLGVSGDKVTMTAGDPAIDRVAFGFQSTGEDPSLRPWRLHHDLFHAGWWELVWAGSGVHQSLKIADSTNGAGISGSLWSFQKRMYFGTNGNTVEWGSAAPVAGSYVVGDIAYNSAATATSAFGWICTSAGSPGVWREVARLAADASGRGPMEVLRLPFTALTPGTADDVTIYAGTCPASRIVDAQVLISTAIAGSTVQLRSAIAGGGVAYSDAFSSATTGRKQDMGAVVTATPVIASGGSIYLRRSNRGVAGEVLIFFQR